MATTQEILKAATDLGKLIASHDAAVKFEESVRKLQADVEAQRVLNDYNRFMNKLGEKEMQGQPIEVEEKKQLEKLQQSVVRNSVLRTFQMAQMDYLDLMRRVDDAMSGGGPEGPALAPNAGGAAGGAGSVQSEVASILRPKK